MTRRLLVEVLTEVPWENPRATPGQMTTVSSDEDPTPADITEWLRAHPSDAVEIVYALRIAGPWEESGTLDGIQYVRRYDLLSDEGHAAAWASDDLWHVNGLDGESKKADSLDAAKSAADAALREAGWALADEVTSG